MLSLRFSRILEAAAKANKPKTPEEPDWQGGTRGRSFHSLRHTFISLLANHDTESAHKIYTHLEIKKLREAVKKPARFEPILDPKSEAIRQSDGHSTYRACGRGKVLQQRGGPRPVFEPDHAALSLETDEEQVRSRLVAQAESAIRSGGIPARDGGGRDREGQFVFSRRHILGRERRVAEDVTADGHGEIAGAVGRGIGEISCEGGGPGRVGQPAELGAGGFLKQPLLNGGGRDAGTEEGEGDWEKNERRFHDGGFRDGDTVLPSIRDGNTRALSGGFDPFGTEKTNSRQRAVPSGFTAPTP